MLQRKTVVDLFAFHALLIHWALQSGRKLGRKLRSSGFGGGVTHTFAIPSSRLFAHVMLKKETVSLMGENQQNPVASPDVHPPFGD